ncbi:hypothetical protein L195_g064754, partial [Trifolium pratense]
SDDELKEEALNLEMVVVGRTSYISGW